MKLFKIHHKNIIYRKDFIKQNKQDMLIYMNEIKQNYPEHKKLFNEIALFIQSKINNKDLKEIDLIDIATKFEKANVFCTDTYETIKGLIFLAKHQNSLFKSKHNWFGNVNMTRSIGLYIEDKVEANIKVSKPYFVDLLNLTIKGFIKVSVGIVYKNSNLLHKSITDFTQAKLMNNNDSNEIDNFYIALIETTENLARSVDEEQNFETIQFTNYLYRVLSIL